MNDLKILIIGTDYDGEQALKTQAQYLRNLFTRKNIKAHLVSKHRNYMLRIIETLFSIIRLKTKSPVIIQVYGTLSIFLELGSAYVAHLFGHLVIVTLHGGDIPNMYKSSKFKRYLFNKLFKLANTITIPSKFIREELPCLKNNPKCKLVNNMIDLADYQSVLPKSFHTIRILWMRSYHEIYNPILAVKTIEVLLKQGHDVQMVMAGSNLGLKQHVQDYICANKLENNIQLLDVIGLKQKNELAKSHNLYLSTNNIDNAPVTFLEMMALGLPVVSTNVGGIPYYVTNEINAIYPKENNEQALADAILSLTQNQKFAENIISGGFNFINEYSEEYVFTSWQKLFNEKGYFIANNQILN